MQIGEYANSSYVKNEKTCDIIKKLWEQFTSDEGMEAYFFRFLHSDNVNKLDAYTDLYCFKVMLQMQ